MPAQVILTVTAGSLAGKKLIAAERMRCIVGRANDCLPRLPNDSEHETVSRHHCLLDINPPDIRVRDFGSLNGTYVNGEMIGCRDEDQSPEQGAALPLPQYDVKDGDEVRVGGTVFHVRIVVPIRCADCGSDIPDNQKESTRWAPDVYQCAQCRAKAAKVGVSGPPSLQARLCSNCGCDVTTEMGAVRRGDFVCRKCRNDTDQLIRRVLNPEDWKDMDAVPPAVRGYGIRKQLGRGGMGAVYLADNGHDQIAIKVLLPNVAVDAQAKKMFNREFENTRSLHHPNVVKVWDSGVSNGIFFFTMEYCDGGSVDKLMRRHDGKLSVATAVRIMFDVLEGLHYAHAADVPQVELREGGTAVGSGLVHRDLKPSNILLCGSGNQMVAKVGDFGVAKAFDTAGLTGFTPTGAFSGTPEMMSHQLIVNFKYARPEVDVWAAAASLYKMLTGLGPRPFPPGVAAIRVLMETNPIPILKRLPTLPPRLAEVIDFALHDHPNIGFKTARDFKKALEAAI